MNKYLAFIRFKFLTSLQFRSEVLLWIFLDFMPFFILFFVFAAMYKTQTVMRGLTFTQTIEYYFLASILQGLTSVHFESWRAEEIRLGKIDTFLLRPFGYFKEIVLSELAGKLFYLCLFFPINFLLFTIVANTFHLQLFAHFSLHFLPVFVFFIGCAFVIQLFLGAIITLLTFWFEGADGLQHFKWVIVTVFSGLMIPLEFMPKWLESLSEALPLKYLYAYPIRFAQGLQILSISDLLMLAATISSLFFMTQVLLRIGVHRYSSSGG